MFLKLAAAAAAVLLLTSAVRAQDTPVKAQDVATLEEIQGQVMVNQGTAFVAGTLAQSLNEGDKVMAAEGASSAIVKYADGCDLKIAAGTIVTLPKLSTCACGIADRESTTPGSEAPLPGYEQDVASLEEIEGNVLVNQGLGFVPGKLGQSLNENDRVMVGDGESSALVKYEDGCDIKVDPGKIVTIPVNSPCQCCGIADRESTTPESEAPPPEDAQDVASLEEIEGNVSVNQGVEFVPGTPGQSLNENDRVMAEEGENSALIKYEDGCDIKVDPGTIVTIPENSPCLCGILLVQNAAPVGGAVIGAGAAGISALPVIFGGLVTGIIYILLSGDDEVVEEVEETVSP